MRSSYPLCIFFDVLLISGRKSKSFSIFLFSFSDIMLCFLLSLLLWYYSYLEINWFKSYFVYFQLSTIRVQFVSSKSLISSSSWSCFSFYMISLSSTLRWGLIPKRCQRFSASFQDFSDIFGLQRFSLDFIYRLNIIFLHCL